MEKNCCCCASSLRKPKLTKEHTFSLDRCKRQLRAIDMLNSLAICQLIRVDKLSINSLKPLAPGIWDPSLPSDPWSFTCSLFKSCESAAWSDRSPASEAGSGAEVVDAAEKGERAAVLAALGKESSRKSHMAVFRCLTLIILAVRAYPISTRATFRGCEINSRLPCIPNSV